MIPSSPKDIKSYNGGFISPDGDVYAKHYQPMMHYDLAQSISPFKLKSKKPWGTTGYGKELMDAMLQQGWVRWYWEGFNTINAQLKRSQLFLLRDLLIMAGVDTHQWKEDYDIDYMLLRVDFVDGGSVEYDLEEFLSDSGARPQSRYAKTSLKPGIPQSIKMYTGGFISPKGEIYSKSYSPMMHYQMAVDLFPEKANPGLGVQTNGKIIMQDMLQEDWIRWYFEWYFAFNAELIKSKIKLLRDILIESGIEPNVVRIDQPSGESDDYDFEEFINDSEVKPLQKHSSMIRRIAKALFK